MTGPRVFAEGAGMGHEDVDEYKDLAKYFLACFLKDSDDDCNVIFTDQTWCDSDAYTFRCTQTGYSAGGTGSDDSGSSTSNTNAPTFAPTEAQSSDGSSDSASLSLIATFVLFMLARL